MISSHVAGRLVVRKGESNMHKPLKVAAVAALALASVVALPATAGAKGPHERSVELRDSCDVATFNAMFGPVCAPHKGRTVTVDKFLAALDPVTHLGHEAWRIQ